MSVKISAEPSEALDWLNRLYDNLEIIGQAYLQTPWSEPDDLEEVEGLVRKQVIACQSLAAIVAALREVPEFHRSAATAPLHDIASALFDVTHGKKPRLFRGVAPSRGGDSTARNYIKVAAVLAVNYLMIGHAYTGHDAREYVAGVFGKHGATGRKGEQLSVSTLQDWCVSVGKKINKEVHQRVDKRLAQMQADPGWPGSLDEVKSWIDRLASDPLVASKYG